MKISLQSIIVRDNTNHYDQLRINKYLLYGCLSRRNNLKLQQKPQHETHGAQGKNS